MRYMKCDTNKTTYNDSENHRNTHLWQMEVYLNGLALPCKIAHVILKITLPYVTRLTVCILGLEKDKTSTRDQRWPVSTRVIFLKLLHCTTHYHTSCKGEMMKSDSHITKSPCEVDAGEVKVRAACLLFLVRLTFPPAIILGVKNKG